MLFLACILARVARFFGAMAGRASYIPGAIALKLCPDLFRRLKFDGKVIVVTGSNGKTTTANQIAHVLRSAGYSVANNTEGANMDTGVATVLACCCTLSGRVREDFLVFETDERWCQHIYKDIQPAFMVVTNLFRDQVVRNGHPDYIFSQLAASVQPGAVLVLNGNDPITARLGPDNPRVYYGMARTSRSSQENRFLTHDCKVCPYCFHHLDYDYYHFNHIGAFRCQNCGYRTPHIDYLASDVDFEKGEFTVAGTPVKVAFHTTFHVMNTAAVLAVCNRAGVPMDKAAAAVGTFEVSKVRYDELDVNGRRAVLMLTKQNATSLDQSVSFALEQPEEKSVLLFVNNVLYSEKKDISWLYDVTFERLRGHVDKVICSGSRAYDIAVRLKQGGFTDGELLVSDSLSEIKGLIPRCKGAIYILAASAFGNEDGILEALK